MEALVSFLASSTLRLLAVTSLAVSGLALTGCGGQTGATCEFDTDCASGVCSNQDDRSTWPRGICVASGGDTSLSADAAIPDAFSAEDAFADDAFEPSDAGVETDAPIEADAPVDAFTPSDAFTEADSAVDTGTGG